MFRLAGYHHCHSIMKTCRWRRLVGALAMCDSPKVICLQAFNPERVCAGCVLADHDPVQPKKAKRSCAHLGDSTRRVDCLTCNGRIELKVFACAVHGECTTRKRVDGVQGCCIGCPDYLTLDSGAPLTGS